MAETPNHLPRSRSVLRHISQFRLKTPMTASRSTTKTPRIHRLFASSGPKSSRVPGVSIRQEECTYDDLLGKTWRPHALSPLYKFKATPSAFKMYASSLSMTFSKGNLMECNDSGQEIIHSSFEVYHGLSFHSDDPDAIRIQVTERHEATETVVLTAMLVCVDVCENDIVDTDMADLFTFYPLLLVCGNKTRAQILIDWLQRHFDCRISRMEFTDADLRWVLAIGCRHDDVKEMPVLLQYDVRSICEGDINTLDCKFELKFCKDLWDKFQSGSTSTEYLMENQVRQFVSALETHLEYTMHILFSKLSLNEVGTPLVYMAREGKMKLFDSKGVYFLLHLMCTLITGKLVKGDSIVLGDLG